MFFKDDHLYFEWHESEIPWVKIFTREPFREISDCSESALNALWHSAIAVEIAMREFYAPKKINIASFGNQLERVHIHIQARFEDDSFYPESMWGVKRREGAIRDLKRKEFERFLIARL
ncbi:MAG: HIT family protein [Helicobacteraceae bacterium]|jgi:diadenosine tetraphosphate (Ap4A) HIT family hydrolase|nr:HIT family protein [Helicobacteraceae bacterium]